MLRPIHAIILSLCTLAATPAFADDVERARQLGSEGLALFERGQWSVAYDKLAEANRLHRAPTLVLYMARAKRNQGKLVEARALYAELANEQLPSKASAPFQQAKADAAREQGELTARIPELLITVKGGAGATVSIDGAAVADVGKPIALDPGSHDVEAQSGEAQARETVMLAEGAGVVNLELVLPAPPSDHPLPGPSEPDEEGSNLLGPAIVAFGVGVAGLAVGIGTGVVAMKKANDVKSRCTQDNHCLTTDEETGKDAQTLSTVSTVGFVIAGVGAATGIVLLVIGTSGDETRAAVRVGPAGLALSVRF